MDNLDKLTKLYDITNEDRVITVNDEVYTVTFSFNCNVDKGIAINKINKLTPDNDNLIIKNIVKLIELMNNGNRTEGQLSATSTRIGNPSKSFNIFIKKASIKVTEPLQDDTSNTEASDTPQTTNSLLDASKGKRKAIK